ncbi:transposase [Candidatus Allofournierella merdipullorum]|uniref:transposase n=1 Tax=Candidatus Allofournierella merdipullorum TaxID=2838595 RepID=UPI00374ED936
MPRKARQLSPSGVYHIMLRGIDKMQIFPSASDSLHFLAILDFVQSPEFEVLAYCLMGNHVHLLIKTTKDNIESLEAAMKSLGVRYVNFFNRKYQRVGTLFQGRFVSQPVATVGYFLRVLRYIHNNPVVAGLAKEPGDYPYNSYQDYFGCRKTMICRVHTEYALRLRPLDWLRAWHTQPEHNPKGIRDVEQTRGLRLKDEDVINLIVRLAGCTPMQVKGLPESKMEIVFHALYEEEGAGIAQLSRLTGISRGIIRRYLL